MDFNRRFSVRYGGLLDIAAVERHRYFPVCGDEPGPVFISLRWHTAEATRTDLPCIIAEFHFARLPV